MGMDVFGRKPVSERGEYFRNNVWWWRPLWSYCCDVAPELCDTVSGHYNDGDGLDENGAKALSEILFREINNGNTAVYEAGYNKALSELPRHSCNFCDGTGIRTDKVGQEMGMPSRELSSDVAIIVGRTHGYCNGCNGEGLVDDWGTSYPFSVDNVKEFAEFLAESGGFNIW